MGGGGPLPLLSSFASRFLGCLPAWSPHRIKYDMWLQQTLKVARETWEVVTQCRNCRPQGVKSKRVVTSLHYTSWCQTLAYSVRLSVLASPGPLGWGTACWCPLAKSVNAYLVLSRPTPFVCHPCQLSRQVGTATKIIPCQLQTIQFNHAHGGHPGRGFNSSAGPGG